MKKRSKSSSKMAGLAALAAAQQAGPPPMAGPAPGGAPMGMKKGGMVKCATGGQIKSTKTENKGGQSKIGGGIEKKASTSTAKITMRGAGMTSKGHTPTRVFSGGGAVRGGGAETKGRTRGRFI